MSTQAGPIISVEWNEDGSATVYGRLMARDGTGDAVIGEGKYLKQADISTITYASYDEASPDTAISSGSVTISSSVFDTPQTKTDDPAWSSDKKFNFRHDLAAANFPTGGKTVVVEYKLTTTGGTVAPFWYRGPVRNMHVS